MTHIPRNLIGQSRPYAYFCAELMMLTTRMSGVSLTLQDISFGVSEEFVSFRLSDYPGATVEDERRK